MIRERSASACRLLAKRTIGARPRARSDPPGLGQAARDAGSRPTHEPEMVMRAVRNVGEAVEVMRRRSDAMASMPFNMASSVEEMVISLTGKANFPFSIQKPAAPREKSEVIALNPKPIISVT